MVMLNVIAYKRGLSSAQEPLQPPVALLEQRKLRVLSLLVRLRREPGPEVRRRNLALREAGYVRPRLLRPHLQPALDEPLQERVVQVHRTARGVVGDLVICLPLRQPFKYSSHVFDFLPGGKTVVDVIQNSSGTTFLARPP